MFSNTDALRPVAEGTGGSSMPSMKAIEHAGAPDPRGPFRNPACRDRLGSVSARATARSSAGSRSCRWRSEPLGLVLLVGATVIAWIAEGRRRA